MEPIGESFPKSFEELRRASTDQKDHLRLPRPAVSSPPNGAGSVALVVAFGWRLEMGVS